MDLGFVNNIRFWQRTQSSPAVAGEVVTPSNTVDIPRCRALYIGVTGDISVDFAQEGTAVVIKNVAVGYHPLSVVRVRVTGTTASEIIALY